MGNIYASPKSIEKTHGNPNVGDAILYKCLAGQNNFKQITSFPVPKYNASNNINKIVIDKENNIFIMALNNLGVLTVFKCQDDKQKFKKYRLFEAITMSEQTPLTLLFIGDDDNLYILFGGYFYKSEKNIK